MDNKMDDRTQYIEYIALMNDLNLLSFYKKHKNEKDNEMLKCPYLKHNHQRIQLNYEKIDDIEDKYTE